MSTRSGLEGAPDPGDGVVRRQRSTGGDEGAQGHLLPEGEAVPGRDVFQDAAGGMVGPAGHAGVGLGRLITRFIA